jgi:4-hydroxy-tetrahydrodipicolinate synthase
MTSKNTDTSKKVGHQDTLNLSGVTTALVTPFKNRQGEVNYDRIKELIKAQAQAGVNGVVPCGTTGESPTVSHEEHEAIVELVARTAKSFGMTTIAGTGSNSTAEAVRLTAQAALAGVDACLIVCPYYNKPSPQGLIAHFSALNEIGVPLVVYNIPGRSGINISPATLTKIAQECSNVIGLKASNGDLDEITEVAALLSKSGRKLAILSGDDSLTLPILSVGGCGVVSVLANVLPEGMVTLYNAWISRNTELAAQVMYVMYPLARALLKIGPNPVPIKALMNEVSEDVGECRLPLVMPSREDIAKLVVIYEQTKSELAQLITTSCLHQ